MPRFTSGWAQPKYPHPSHLLLRRTRHQPNDLHHRADPQRGRGDAGPGGRAPGTVSPTPGTRGNRRPGVSGPEQHRDGARPCRQRVRASEAARTPASIVPPVQRPGAGAHADTPSGPPSSTTKGKCRPSTSDRRRRESIPTAPSDADKRRNGTHRLRPYKRTPDTAGLPRQSDAGPRAPRPHRAQARPQAHGPRSPTERRAAARARPPRLTRCRRPRREPRTDKGPPDRQTAKWRRRQSARRGQGLAEPHSPPPGAAHLRAMDARQVRPAEPRSAPRASGGGRLIPPGLAPLQGQEPMSRRSERRRPRSELTARPGAKRSAAGDLSPRPFAKAPGSPDRRAGGRGRAAPGRRDPRLPGPPRWQRAALRRGRCRRCFSRGLSSLADTPRVRPPSAVQSACGARGEGRGGARRRNATLPEPPRRGRAAAGVQRDVRRRRKERVPPPSNVVLRRRSLAAAATSLFPDAAASVRRSSLFGLGGGCHSPAVPRAGSG